MNNESLYKILTVTGDDMMINIDEAKAKIQKENRNYIVGAKFVTSEDAETVLSSIKKDLRIYRNVVRFIVRDNMIDIALDNNATLCTYYFTKNDVFEEVLNKLPQLDIAILRI